MLPIKLDLPKKFFDEEIRDGYTVSREMKKIWAVELDLLKQFMNVCEKHNITYYDLYKNNPISSGDYLLYNSQ